MHPSLMRPREFQRRCAEEFRTLRALRYHITRRHANGLVASGAVVETPIGLRIDPERFEIWMRGRGEAAA